MNAIKDKPRISN